MSDTRASRYKTAGEALKQLNQDFNEWCSILTGHSVQAAYAIIAANWAVHGAADAILHNSFAKWSVAVVVLFLGVNLVGTHWMIRIYHRQYLHAEENPDHWQQEFQEYLRGERRFWPYTKRIEYLGVGMRIVKAFAPLAGAVLFVLSLF